MTEGVGYVGRPVILLFNHDVASWKVPEVRGNGLFAGEWRKEVWESRGLYIRKLTRLPEITAGASVAAGGVWVGRALPRPPMSALQRRPPLMTKSALMLY